MSSVSSLVSNVGWVALHLFGELVAPSRCAACDEPLDARALFCPPCAGSVDRAGDWAETDGSHVAAFDYGGAVATAIARLKYEERADLAPRLGQAMVPAASRIADAIDLVVPVPLHPRRLVERGYNQAALLAAPVARALAKPFVPRGLLRLRETPKQATLDRATRLVNVRNAFVARGPLVEGSRILLVDDVRTTGATLASATLALHEAGVRSVVHLVLASRA